MEEAFKKKRGIVMEDERIKIIKYGNDQAVVSESEEELQSMVNNILRLGKECAMKINTKKNEGNANLERNKTFNIEVNRK